MKWWAKTPIGGAEPTATMLPATVGYPARYRPCRPESSCSRGAQRLADVQVPDTGTFWSDSQGESEPVD